MLDVDFLKLKHTLSSYNFRNILNKKLCNADFCMIYDAHDVSKLFRHSRSYEIRIYASASSNSIVSEEKHPFIPVVIFFW